MAERYNLAAIDIGTNSIHLIIASVNENGIEKILSKDKEVVRLGKSSSDMKYLSADAIKRGVDSLKRFRLLCDSFNARIRAVATSATREAINKYEFIDKAFAETGIKIEVISGTEEARLIYLGVLQALHIYDKKILLFDIGGGSTEFIIGKKGKMDYANSIKIGAVRLSEKFFSEGKFNDDTIAKAKLHVRSIINPVVRHIKSQNYELVIGTSGTTENIASMIYHKNTTLPNPEFNFNNFSFSYKDVEDISKTIYKNKSVSQIKKIAGLDNDRADIITAGAIILQQIFSELSIKNLHISSYALREGILFDTIDKTHNTLETGDISNIRYSSVIKIAENYKYDSSHVKKVFQFASKIFDYLKSEYKMDNGDKDYLEAASILHDIGHSISQSQHHRHSYYLIRNSDLLGYNDEEIEIISNVARYHRKSHPKQKHPEYLRLSKSNQEKVNRLSAMLRIADGLDRAHKGNISDIEIIRQSKDFIITVIPENSADVSLEIWGANARKELFEETFGYNVIIKK